MTLLWMIVITLSIVILFIITIGAERRMQKDRHQRELDFQDLGNGINILNKKVNSFESKDNFREINLTYLKVLVETAHASLLIRHRQIVFLFGSTKYSNSRTIIEELETTAKGALYAVQQLFDHLDSVDEGLDCLDYDLVKEYLGIISRHSNMIDQIFAHLNVVTPAVIILNDLDISTSSNETLQ